MIRYKTAQQILNIGHELDKG